MNSRVSNGSVLIVDRQSDGSTLRQAMTEAGYEVLQASDELAAVEMAAELAPDLLLLEVFSPNDDSFQICENLRDDPDTKAMPVMIVSALPGMENRLKALEAGALDYLVAPVEPVELRLRVRNLVKQSLLSQELQASLRATQQEEQRRDEWSAYVVHELEDTLSQLEIEDPMQRRVLEDARELSSAISACRRWRGPQAPVSFGRCDLSAIVSEMAGFVDADLDYHELSGEVQGDPRLLTRLLRQLIQISAGLSGEGNRAVRLRSCDPVNGNLTVEILSCGSRIRHAMFSRLEGCKLPGQAIDCRSRSEFYLSFCRHAMDLMGGDIGVETLPGEGVRFWFTLPLKESPLPDNVIAFEPASQLAYDNAASR